MERRIEKGGLFRSITLTGLVVLALTLPTDRAARVQVGSIAPGNLGQYPSGQETTPESASQEPQLARPQEEKSFVAKIVFGTNRVIINNLTGRPREGMGLKLPNATTELATFLERHPAVKISSRTAEDAQFGLWGVNVVRGDELIDLVLESNKAKQFDVKVLGPGLGEHVYGNVSLYPDGVVKVSLVAPNLRDSAAPELAEENIANELSRFLEAAMLVPVLTPGSSDGERFERLLREPFWPDPVFTFVPLRRN